MKRLYTITCSIALLFACTSLQAQTMDQNAWMAYMTPGDMHKVLAESTGEWTGEITMWMEPGKDPIKSKGTSSNKMILGGRYLETRNKGDFMGQPMEGIGVTGYDNAKKQFESTWIDNMGTGIMKMTGNYDAAAKTINFTGTMVDPGSGKEMAVRETYQMIDVSHHTMTMYMTPEGAQEFKTMEIKFTRK